MQIATRTAAVTHTLTDTAIRRRLSSGSTAAGSWHQTTSGRRGTGNERKPKRPRRRGAPQSLRHAVSVRRLISPRTPHRCIRMRGSFGVSGFRRRLMSSALLSCSGSRQKRFVLVGIFFDVQSEILLVLSSTYDENELISARNGTQPTRWRQQTASECGAASSKGGPFWQVQRRGLAVPDGQQKLSNEQLFSIRKLHGAGVRGRCGLALQGRKVETRCPATKS